MIMFMNIVPITVFGPEYILSYWLKNVMLFRVLDLITIKMFVTLCNFIPLSAEVNGAIRNNLPFVCNEFLSTPVKKLQHFGLSKNTFDSWH